MGKLTHKSNAFEIFKSLAKQLQNEKGHVVKAIRADHGTEFENHDFATFCDQHGINHNFTVPYKF